MRGESKSKEERFPRVARVTRADESSGTIERYQETPDPIYSWTGKTNRTAGEWFLTSSCFSHASTHASVPPCLGPFFLLTAIEIVLAPMRTRAGLRQGNEETVPFDVLALTILRLPFRAI